MTDVLESAVRDYVIHSLPLGIYDPLHPRRARVPVSDFVVELLEVVDSIVHAAGPVILSGPQGPVKFHLRMSGPLTADGTLLWGDPTAIRAAYIVETDPQIGACKETAALANL